MKKTISKMYRSLMFFGVVVIPFVADAQETKTFTYDALGRVVGTSTSGGPANGTNTTYQYDAASNRSQVTVTNSPNGNGSGVDTGSGASVSAVTYVVVPLNGYTVIRIQK